MTDDEADEDGDAAHDEVLTAKHVRKLAHHGDDDGGGEQVDREDPGELVEATEVGKDARGGGGNDRLVERAHEHTEHERDEEHPFRALLERFAERAVHAGYRGGHAAYPSPELATDPRLRRWFASRKLFTSISTIDQQHLRDLGERMRPR